MIVLLRSRIGILGLATGPRSVLRGGVARACPRLRDGMSGRFLAGRVRGTIGALLGGLLLLLIRLARLCKRARSLGKRQMSLVFGGDDGNRGTFAAAQRGIGNSSGIMRPRSSPLERLAEMGFCAGSKLQGCTIYGSYARASQGSQ